MSAVVELGLIALAIGHDLGFVVGGGFVRVIHAPLAAEVNYALEPSPDERGPSFELNLLIYDI